MESVMNATTAFLLIMTGLIVVFWSFRDIKEKH